MDTPAADTDAPAFEVVVPPGGARVPVVGHVPHASGRIPSGERARLRLDDDALAAELLRLTDVATDRLAARILHPLGAALVVNRLSRLVVDPERFADDAREPMAGVGQGAVYTRTTGGDALRDPDPGERDRLLETYFVPYHRALEAVVAAALDAWGRCLLLDVHSFASVPLPSEPDQDPDRPDVCLGTDRVHTPLPLVAALLEALAAAGFRVAVDRPFAGALVPLRWYGRDPRVASLMLEVRRGTYLAEATGDRLPGFEAVADRLAGAVGPVLARDWAS